MLRAFHFSSTCCLKFTGLDSDLCVYIHRSCMIYVYRFQCIEIIRQYLFFKTVVMLNEFLFIVSFKPQRTDKQLHHLVLQVWFYSMFESHHFSICPLFTQLY